MPGGICHDYPLFSAATARSMITHGEIFSVFALPKSTRGASLRQHAEVFKGAADAVVIHRSGYVDGCLFHLVRGIAHGHACGYVFEHGDVVAAVAKGHGFFEVDAVMCPYVFDTGLFAASGHIHIREMMRPTAVAAMLHYVLHYVLHLRIVGIETHLIHGLANDIVWVLYAWRLQAYHPGGFEHKMVDAADCHFVCGHEGYR